MNKERFTVDDVIAAGGCPSGIRRWFTSAREMLPEGITLRSFLREGIPVDQARALGDGFVDRALEIKEARYGREE